jgi:hypothetical protein
MKRILQLCLLSLLIMSGSAFTPSQKHVSVKVKNSTGNETIDVYAGPGLGAHEVVIYVSRTGPDAGVGSVGFDVDLMIDYIPEHVQTFHVDVPAGYTSSYGYYYCNWVVGTDATVVGSIYNVTYY